MNRFGTAVLGLVLMAGGTTALAQKNPDVGNVAMSNKKTLLENATASPIHRRLMNGLTSSGLVNTLSEHGPYTLFAPTDDAFARLPAGTLTTWMQPDNKTQLTRVLSNHIVQGKLTAGKLGKMVKKGKGTATLKTLAGGTITVTRAGSILILKDEKGGTATVTTPDVYGKNGVMHVIDAVLLPAS